MMKDKYIKLTNDVLKMLESKLDVHASLETIDENGNNIYVRIIFPNDKVIIEDFRSNMFEACGTDWVYEFLKGQTISSWNKMIFRK